MCFLIPVILVIIRVAALLYRTWTPQFQAGSGERPILTKVLQVSRFAHLKCKGYFHQNTIWRVWWNRVKLWCSSKLTKRYSFVVCTSGALHFSGVCIHSMHGPGTPTTLVWECPQLPLIRKIRLKTFSRLEAFTFAGTSSRDRVPWPWDDTTWRGYTTSDT